ncbi:protein of unknown function DUF632 [Dillenia turbinata]|uniref:DUF632 domain-containing protein n=1 Tax=Dillenia turbinata TaxID=194707 RepID=A0AAN8YZ63_9MAGN
MGCIQSKIENEEVVSRCKEQKLFMKDAVSLRNGFAAAHSAYVMSLKNIGAALSDYAQGEVQNPNPNPNPTVTLDTPPPPPPPPPPPNFTTQPLQRAASMPESAIPKSEPKPSNNTIIEEDEEEIEESSLRGRRKQDRVVENPPPPPPRRIEMETPRPPSLEQSTWDFFFPGVENMPGPNLSDVDENRSEMERKMYSEMAKKSEENMVSKSAKVKPEVVVEKVAEATLPPPPPEAAVVAVKPARSVNLMQIFNELDDHFLKASESAHEVSKMLEANRLHYHSNFADNRGHIDHSARVMRVITWNRSFRGMPNAEDVKKDFDSKEYETHATVLDKLLAWEKKQYDEVKYWKLECFYDFKSYVRRICALGSWNKVGLKMDQSGKAELEAGKLTKLDYQKKVAMLNKQKKRGASPESLEKLKAAVSHLHTRYIVDMQSMDSTVSEINRLRDEQLYPKLVAFVDGMATMWETMKMHHESQLKMVMALKYLDISQSVKETSMDHHQRSRQLLEVAQIWHSQFERLVTKQKGYIRALNSWLKLNLTPIESSLKEKVSSPARPQNPPIQHLLIEWHDGLESLHDELARIAILNFAAVVETIEIQQEEELKLKERCEDIQRDLNRKQWEFEEWKHKYLQRHMAPDELDPERAEEGAHKDAIAERQLLVDRVHRELVKEVEAYQKQCFHVREKSLTSLKGQMPELFRAMSTFTRDCTEMYNHLRSISHHQRPVEGS